nr:MAG TPA: hypothetical protein [Caudoviricetes sp.]
MNFHSIKPLSFRASTHRRHEWQPSISNTIPLYLMYVKTVLCFHFNPHF